MHLPARDATAAHNTGSSENSMGQLLLQSGRRHQLCRHPDFSLLASRLGEDKFLLFKAPILWFLVTAL